VAKSPVSKRRHPRTLDGTGRDGTGYSRGVFKFLIKALCGTGFFYV